MLGGLSASVEDRTPVNIEERFGLAEELRGNSSIHPFEIDGLVHRKGNIRHLKTISEKRKISASSHRAT
jgi:hypothetical protein